MNKVGLALSGGGYRAAAFHLGVLEKLYKMNVLQKVDNISTISGGSILGSYYIISKSDFSQFYSSFKNFLTKRSIFLRVVFSLRFITVYLSYLGALFIFYEIFDFDWLKLSVSAVSLAVIYLIFFHKLFPSTDVIIRLYDKLLFKRKLIIDLPDKPNLIINTTNLQTGTLFTFTRKEITDNSYKYPNYGSKPIRLKKDKFRVSQAVASSTCVPFAFKPFKVAKDYFENAVDNRKQKPYLVDGGIYDNQGIYRLMSGEYKSDIIICSDASYPYKDNYSTLNLYFVLRRTTSILMKRIRAFQFTDSIYQKTESIKEIAYFSLNWRYETCLKNFYTALCNNQIREHVLTYHKIPDVYLKNPSSFQDEIITHVKNNIEFDQIISFGIKDTEVDMISTIKTGLSPLRPEEFEFLKKHGSTLTELLIKLYCPTLTSK